MPAPCIVVGVDFSKASRKAMLAAAMFGKASGARVVLVHAFQQQSNILVKGELSSGATRKQIRAGLARAALEEVTLLTTKWAEMLRKTGVEVEAVAPEGKPLDVLLAEAKRRKASLIVLGTTGKGFLERMFLGSTARRVAEKSPVPVLLFPERGRIPTRRAGPVVVGLDLGPGSDAVAAAAGALARDLGAPLHGLHALFVPQAWGDFAGGAFVYTPAMLATDEEEAGHAMTELVEGLRGDVQVQNFIELGDAATAVLTHAKRVKASCIVVGRRRNRRTGFGSVSATLAQHADRPLLIVAR